METLIINLDFRNFKIFDFIIAFSLNCGLELLIGGEMFIMFNILRKCHIMLSLGSNNCNNRQADDAREGTV